MDLLGDSYRSLLDRRSRDGLILRLLLLAAGKNGNGRKSKNRDGLHIYLTWYMVYVLLLGMSRRNGQILLIFLPLASLK